jgi:hypothetical protein
MYVLEPYISANLCIAAACLCMVHRACVVWNGAQVMTNVCVLQAVACLHS